MLSFTALLWYRNAFCVKDINGTFSKSVHFLCNSGNKPSNWLLNFADELAFLWICSSSLGRRWTCSPCCIRTDERVVTTTLHPQLNSSMRGSPVLRKSQVDIICPHGQMGPQENLAAKGVTGSSVGCLVDPLFCGHSIYSHCNLLGVPLYFILSLFRGWTIGRITIIETCS